ncbi:MAG: ester cyclase [Chloroflexia bacterium]
MPVRSLEIPPAQNKRVVQQMLEVFNTGKVEVLDKVVSREHVDESPFPGTKGNRDGLKQQILVLREAFPDANFTIYKMSAQGDTVAFRWTKEGTHKGEFLAGPRPARK